MLGDEQISKKTSDKFPIRNGVNKWRNSRRILYYLHMLGTCRSCPRTSPDSMNMLTQFSHQRRFKFIETNKFHDEIMINYVGLCWMVTIFPLISLSSSHFLWFPGQVPAASLWPSPVPCRAVAYVMRTWRIRGPWVGEPKKTGWLYCSHLFFGVCWSCGSC